MKKPDNNSKKEKSGAEVCNVVKGSRIMNPVAATKEEMFGESQQGTESKV